MLSFTDKVDRDVRSLCEACTVTPPRRTTYQCILLYWRDLQTSIVTVPAHNRSITFESAVTEAVARFRKPDEEGGVVDDAVAAPELGGMNVNATII